MNRYTYWLYELAPLYGLTRQPWFEVNIYQRANLDYSDHLVIQLN